MKEMSRIALAYILWAVSVVVAGGVGLIARDAFSTVLTMAASTKAGTDQSADFYLGLQLRAAEPWMYIIFGLFLIAVIAFVEYYYRIGAGQELLLQRFLLVTGVEIGVLTVAHVARFLVVAALGAAAWSGLVLPIIELVVTGIFIWLYRRMAAHKAAI